MLGGGCWVVEVVWPLVRVWTSEAVDVVLEHVRHVCECDVNVVEQRLSLLTSSTGGLLKLYLLHVQTCKAGDVMS